jgi:APA family basic amino acid/polyamine antiporter
VAISAIVILVSAAQAAMLGLSRLGYALAVNRQIPSKMGSLSRTRATPVGIIGFGAVMAICLLIPADMEFLAAICAFGATIAFTIVGASVVWLRYKEPDRDRPYRMPLNVPFRGGSLPIPAVLCVVMSVTAFVALLVEHGSARWVGVIWMVAGVSLYVGYRTSQGKSVLKRVTVPEAALTRRAAEAEFGSMLVPILGTPLDDDIMQTAGRLASEENEDEGGAVIEALWIFEVPMALPLDTRVPDLELKRARAALNRAKAVGEEYQGVEVATAVVRARKAGQAIVREAKRRGVEAIVLAAEEPTRVGGGLRLGGKPGLHDTSVGETTRYVVNKAHCRVILTAPPSVPALDPTGPVPVEPPLPLGHALGVSEADASR